MFEICNLTKFYSKISQPAVENLNLTIRDGEIFGFAGLNGAGKTTTIRISAGVLYPTSGTVLIDGKDIVTEKIDASYNIGWIPESPSFEPGAKPLSLMKYFGGFYGMKTSESMKRGKELLELVKLDGELDKKFRNYSQGMKKRFALAAAMLSDPGNYLFDETSTGLDPDGIRFVRNLLLDLKRKGKAILVSSHILDELENVCDKVAIINRGKLIEVVDRERIWSMTVRGTRLEDHFLELIDKPSQLGHSIERT
ncbi:MAG: ABC transporter ATP-binding protein [Thermoplasmata archaeon]|nr:ABC transporter ATP-binding protein [Candidatus Sysuiplasma acidicola]MBX8647040.1 ABC transporter ATP-binding protein [Candidatus Sysuiplasma acidicola]